MNHKYETQNKNLLLRQSKEKLLERNLNTKIDVRSK
jgi:hypothetical protein